MSDTSKGENEVSVGADGVKVKGELVTVLVKPVRRVADTADSVLRLASNLITTPLDYVSRNIEQFRSRYRERFDEIPLESRVEPPMRLACAVLQQVPFSADEPDIQELFAQLLASASNAQTLERAHPGFATVISELHSVDAQVLRYIAKETSQGQPIHEGLLEHATGIDRELSRRSISNLIRLGLLEWKDTAYTPAELGRFVGKQQYSFPQSPERTRQFFVEAVNDLQKLKNEIVKQLSKQHEKRALFISKFGQDFIDVVIRLT